VLQKLALYSCGTKKNSKKKDEASNDIDSQKKDMIRLRVDFKVQGAFLELAKSLLKYNDATIMSYIASPGVKESKLKPGILYLCLRGGLVQGQKLVSKNESTSSSSEAAYQLSLFHFLRSVRMQMYHRGKGGEIGESDSSRARSTLSNRALVSVLKYPCRNISFLYTCSHQYRYLWVQIG